MPLNTLQTRVACKFIGFTNFVIKLDYSHFCSESLHKKLSTLCNVTVHYFRLLHSQLYSNVTLYSQPFDRVCAKNADVFTIVSAFVKQNQIKKQKLLCDLILI